MGIKTILQKLGLTRSKAQTYEEREMLRKQGKPFHDPMVQTQLEMRSQRFHTGF